MLYIYNFLLLLSLINTNPLPAFDEDHLYIFARATKSKSAIISQFNIKNAAFNHIGIGLHQNNTINIYEFSDEYGFIKQDIVSFITFETTSIYIYSISISAIQRDDIIDLVESYEGKGFDHDFELGNDKYYCSEFCYSLLNEIFPGRYQPSEMSVIDPFLKAYLQRDVFRYIPVDFFLASHHFTLLYKQSPQ